MTSQLPRGWLQLLLPPVPHHHEATGVGRVSSGLDLFVTSHDRPMQDAQPLKNFERLRSILNVEYLQSGLTAMLCACCSSMTAIDTPEKKATRASDGPKKPSRSLKMKPMFLSFEALPVAPLPPLQLWVPKTCNGQRSTEESKEPSAASKVSVWDHVEMLCVAEVKP